MHTGLGVVEPPCASRAVSCPRRSESWNAPAITSSISLSLAFELNRAPCGGACRQRSGRSCSFATARPGTAVWPMLSKPVSGPSCLNMRSLGLRRAAVMNLHYPAALGVLAAAGTCSDRGYVLGRVARWTLRRPPSRAGIPSLTSSSEAGA